MKQVGIVTVGDVFAMELSTLEQHFGSYGLRLYELARGIDLNPVVANRLRKQISAEDTFPDDILLEQCVPHLLRIAEKLWRASRDNSRRAKTVVLRLKTKEFSSLTRSQTHPGPVSSCEELVQTALSLLLRVNLEPQ